MKMRLNTILIMIIVSFTIMLMMTNSVFSADQWDRPVYSINYTPQFLNISNQLIYLQNQIINETQYRISNDTYLQNQINNIQINITQLFNITTIYGLNITELYNITNDLEQQIDNIQSDILDIYINIDNLYNITYILQNNISTIFYSIEALNVSIISINHSLTNLSTYINASINYLNDSINQINSTIKQPLGQYLSYNSTNFWINETSLNTTINNISQNRQNLYITTINITNNTGQFTTNYSIKYLLTKIDIEGQNNFRSECIEYINGNIIDKDRMMHHYSWIIEKNYAINDKINCTISNADNGLYNITLTYLSNGLQ